MRPMPRHIIIKMSAVNDKKRILKAARIKQLVIHKGTKTISRIFSKLFTGQKGVAGYIQKVERKKTHNFQPRIFYLAKLFRIEGVIVSR